MSLFKRKRINQNERIVLATTGELAELDSPATRQHPPISSARVNETAPETAESNLRHLTDLELFGAFVISRGKGDRETMAAVQRELENRGRAADIAQI